jgi:hypothetical protein
MSEKKYTLSALKHGKRVKSHCVGRTLEMINFIYLSIKGETERVSSDAEVVRRTEYSSQSSPEAHLFLEK